MPLSRNILIFNHSYATQFIDVSNQYARLYNEKDRVTVVYLTGKPDEEIKQKTLAHNVIFLDCSPRQTRGLKIAAIIKMLKLHREKSFDVVICHRYKPTYIMLWVSKFRKIPIFIAVMHELGTMRHLSRKILTSLLAPHYMIFAGVSNAVRDDMRRSMWRISPGQIITLYNMIDVDFTEPRLLNREAARQHFNIPETTFLFGNVGRLAKNKDHKTLLDAFARIKNTCKNSKLIILGDGQLETTLREQAKTLGIENDVILTGFVPEAFRYMKAFDTYVTSAIQEAFGRVLLEAMIARIPIIATRVNGMPEVLDNTGVLVDPSDPEQLAIAMQKAYQTTDTERIKTGEKTYQRAVKEFSISRFNEVMSKILLPGLDSNQ